VYVKSTEARVTKDKSCVTALNRRWKGHKEAAAKGVESELYAAMRECGVEAFTGCELLAHYVLPAPPKSWRAALQSEFKKAEMAQKEGYWMDQLNARVTGYNKKSEGLCMD
jgi:hypothetical protein